MAHVACFTAPLYVCATLRPPHLLSFSSRLSLDSSFSGNHCTQRRIYPYPAPCPLFPWNTYIYRIYIYVWTISPVRTLFASCLRHFSRRLSCTKCNTFDCTHVQVLWPKWLPELESWSLKGGGEEKKSAGIHGDVLHFSTISSARFLPSGCRIHGLYHIHSHRRTRKWIRMPFVGVGAWKCYKLIDPLAHWQQQPVAANCQLSVY